MPDVAPAPPRLLVAILNWNTPDLSLRCLDALQRSEGCDYTACIVDNGSSDESLALFARMAPEVEVIALAENLGFAGGHGAALAWARLRGYTLVCLLNSDAVLATDTLALLSAAWQSAGDALYAAVPWAWGRDGTRWANLPEKYLDPQAVPHAWRRDRAVALTEAWAAQPPRVVAAVPGCCLLVPVELVDRHGWMGEEWFLYCEELDWCLRLRRQGIRSVLVPAAQVQHAGGGSQRADPRLRAAVDYYRARNEIVLAARHAGRWTAVQVAAKKLLRALSRLPSAPRRAWAGCMGVIDAARGRMGRTRVPQAAVPAASGRAIRIPLLVERIGDRAREFLRRSGLQAKTAGASRLCVERKPLRLLRAFHDHVARLLASALRSSLQAVDARLGTPAGADAPGTWRIDLQVEHTLVRPGGRDSDGATPGVVPLPAGEDGHYLVRLVETARLARQDLIVDYSRPNLEQLASSGQFAALRARMRAIAPLWYPTHADPAGRDLSCISQFADLNQPRRRQFLDDCARSGRAVRNITGIWRAASLQRLYRRTRILLNVHQTDHHHTFEELRVLPALACGVIVISEDVPLRHCVPYHAHILWSDLAGMPKLLAEVQADYAGWHQRLFGDGRLRLLLEELRIGDQLQMRAALRDWQSAQGTARPIPAS